MTALLLIVLGLYAALSVYLAASCVSRTAGRDGFLDADGVLPGWTMVFGGVGVTLASLGLPDHLRLVARFGLQYSHVALGLVLVAMCGTLVQKRLWLAARLMGRRSPVDLLGSYYGSVGLRVLLLGLVVLFAVPFAASALSLWGDLLASATGGIVTRLPAIWVSGFFLFLPAIIGGWRGVVYGVAAQSFLMIVLLLVLGGAVLQTPGRTAPIAVPAGTVPDMIPGVLQYTRGLGKDVALGGPWTTAAILSFALSLIGIVLSPGMAFLSITTTSRSGFAFSQTWMVAALGGGLLLFTSPLLATWMTGQGTASFGNLIDRLHALDAFLSVLVVVSLAASLQIAVAFFAGSGAQVIAMDLVCRYVRPALSPDGRRRAARVTLAVTYAAMALLASAAPLPATLLSSATLSLSAQLLPAFLGLCWVPWISRSAVMTGLIVGILLVVFTEPPGLVLFEELFLDLPWGRWPLTIHSALWGLTFNGAACLLVSIFTQGGEERVHRDILHRAFAADAGGGAAGGAQWSLVLIWAFLAIGPGAILGNDFFKHPVFTEGETTLGVPSLWVWQVVFWFAGVFLVWWLAYPTRLSVLDLTAIRPVGMIEPTALPGSPQAPAWIALLLDRVATRTSIRRDRKTT